MKRLRHPIRAIREPFGTAGLIVACLALVAALGGTAFAAGRLNGTQKKEVAKIAQKEAKKFATAGPQGPAGANGKDGSNGKDGANGTNGTNGSPGANGKSVVSGSFEGTDEPAGEPCEEEGGVEFEVEGSGAKNYACNGAEGAKGSPWAVGGTLPVGATETGYYTFFSSDPAEQSVAYTQISFPVPLAAELDASHAVFVTTSENPDPTHCSGSMEEPKAASGYLCVYAGPSFESEFLAINSLSKMPGGNTVPGTQGAGTAGAILRFTAYGKEALEEGIPVRGRGAFAVTG